MYQHIMVAVDGSAASERALQEAIRVAQALGARLRIVNVVDKVTLSWEAEYTNPAEIWAAMEKAGRTVLDKAVAAAAVAGIEADSRLVEITAVGQRIPQAIVEEAEAWPADLIVVGTHGRRGLSHVLLGSVAEGIARIATRPLLLVRAG